MIIVSVLMLVRPVPKSPPISRMFRRSRPSQISSPCATTVVVGVSPAFAGSPSAPLAGGVVALVAATVVVVVSLAELNTDVMRSYWMTT